MSMALKAAKGHGGGMRMRAAGDPGLFGGIFGAVKGAAKSVLTGGNPLAGALTGAVGGFTSGGRASQAQAQANVTRMYATRSWSDIAKATPGWTVDQLQSLAIPGRGSPAPVGAIVPQTSPGVTVSSFAPPSSMAPPSMNGKRPPGYHWNKSGYFLRSGEFVPPESRLVRNRRRNPLNPRALRKAVGRVNAAKSWQSMLSSISTGKYTAAGKKRC